MADHNVDWSTDSTKAIYISLVAPGAKGLKTLHTFNPQLTYSIFGEEERIFGYQGLRINLRYNASDMRPSVQILYNKRFKTVGGTSPTRLKDILEVFLPKTAFEKADLFNAAISNSSGESFQPPGELLRTIEVRGQKYEIWKGCLADLAVQQMIKRVQILVPFFIEGGCLIDLRDPDWSLERWSVFFLYKKMAKAGPKVSPYLFMGYSTTYRYFHFTPLPSPPSSTDKKERISHPANLDFELPYPDTSLSDLRSRCRISQFVLLPPFQGKGIGSMFYNELFDHYLQDPNTVEITVEDPNEAFDDMRDLNDLARLREDEEFSALRINSDITIEPDGAIPKDIVDPAALDKIRSRFKISPRQFNRLVEMQLLSLVPPGVRRSRLIINPNGTVAQMAAQKYEYELWELRTKERVYRQNRDVLIQLDLPERISSMKAAMGRLEADYIRLIGQANSRALAKKAREEELAAAGSKTVGEEELATPGSTTAGEEGPPSKKAKVANED